MGLRIVLLLLFLVSSVVFFLVHQVTTIITVVNNHGDPPDAKNVGRYDDSLALNDQEGDIMSFVQVGGIHSCFLMLSVLYSDKQCSRFYRFPTFTSACSKTLKDMNN